MSNDKTSSLAHELGTIASGEVWHSGSSAALHERCTKRCAAGIERLIDERVAAAVAPLVERMGLLETAERDGSATLAREDKAATDVRIGSRFRWVDGGHAGEIGEVTAGPVARLGSPSWQLTTGDHVAMYYESMLTSPALFTPALDARPVRAVEVPKAPAREPDGNERIATAEEMASPAPAVVAVGDTFLAMREVAGENAGRVFTVTDVEDAWVRAKSPKLQGDTVAPWCQGDASIFLDPAEFQRVPAGYTLPPAMAWHAATRRLIEAYRASLADPETGLKGAHECVRAMAHMAGMEVPE